MLIPAEPRLARKLLEPLGKILSTSRAKSLQFECIRTLSISLQFCAKSDGTVPKIVPQVVKLVVENLIMNIKSDDKNVIYLSLQGLRQLLISNPDAASSYHEVILECLESPDSTIRIQSIQLLCTMATKSNIKPLINGFLNKVMKNSGLNTLYGVSIDDQDALIIGIMNIGGSDKYRLISDFEWYFHVLLKMSVIKNISADIKSKVAFQIRDIFIRVSSVRDMAMEALLSIVSLYFSTNKVTVSVGMF